jgi:hypothetical protein
MPAINRHQIAMRLPRIPDTQVSPFRWLLAAAFLACTAALSAQAPPAVDAATRQQVIDGAIEHLQRGYIFEDVAAKMAAALRAHVKAGAYDAVTSGADFAALVTTHLREVSRDKHLRILYDPAGISGAQPPAEEERTRRAAAERRNNWGLHRVERLDGNVGYIELR